MQLNSYVTLAAFRERLGLAASDTGDDARILARLRAATAQIDRYVGRHFWPLVATRRFDWRNARTLLFRGFDLLELTSIINGDGSTIDPSAILSLGGTLGPIIGVELDVSKAFFVYQSTITRAIAVQGVWGWHNDYANAWKPSGDSIPGGGITGSATSFTVTSVGGSDSWGFTPRFSAGQLIKVDAEFMHIIATNSATNTLTVVRAANGSSSAAHSAGAAISIYVPPTDIQEIALRWADWLYRMEDAAQFVAVPGDSSITAPITAPAAIPRDLLAALSNLRLIGGAA